MSTVDPKLLDEIDEALPEFSVATLRGSECETVGTVTAIAEGAAAIALSRGGAAKRYTHKHPNEDAVAFTADTGGVLLVVADGHGGRDAAEIAVDEVVRCAGKRFTNRAFDENRETWENLAIELIAGVHTAILAAVTQGVPDSARTTLAFALVRPRDNWLAFASMGDSHIFRVGPAEALDLAFDPDRRSTYLGHPADTRESLIEKCVVGFEELGGVRAVVLATDGISERGIGVDLPESTVGECTARAQQVKIDVRPLEIARSIAEETLAAHRHNRAGDNIATAVVCLP